MTWDGRRDGGCGQFVKDYVPSDFYCSAVIVGVFDPYEVPFCVLGIAEKAASFPTWLEFREVIDDDARCASCAEGAEV